MNKFENYSKFQTWLVALLLSAFVAGCGGGGDGRDPILGVGAIAVLGPTVTAVTPLANATGVPVNTRIITAAFSKAMNPATLTTASFTLTCPGYVPGGAFTVSYVAAGSVATLTLPALPDLPATTVCTATVTTAATDTTAIALAANFVWTFTTGVAPDTTKPTVTSTTPATGVPPAATPSATAGVPTNTAINAVFSEDMAPATIVAAGTFTVTCLAPCVSPVGAVVTYAVGSRTATFTPAAALTALTTYTATIKGTGATPATDLAGNALAGNTAALPAASDYVWTFTTAAAAAPPGNISVSATDTTCPNAVNATFTVPSGLGMNAVSVAANLRVTDAASANVNGTVALNAAGTIATFTPTVALTPGASFTLTITGGAAGVMDNAVPTANTLNVNPFTLGFIPGPATGACIAPAPLAAAASFANYGGSAGMTNSGINTIMNGDIGTIAASTLVTGFHDTSVAYVGPPVNTGCTYTETVLNIGVVNGLIYTAAPPPTVSCPLEGTAATLTIAQAAALDAYNKFNALAVLPGGTVLGVAGAAGALELGTRTLAPGIYSSASTYAITLGDLTLDAGGNANAVWVFQMGTSLTVGIAGPAGARNVILTNGAQAKNVYWVAGTGTNGPGRVVDGGAGSATINGAGGGTMVGTIIATAAISFSTAGVAATTTLNGRAITVKGPLIGGVPSAGAGVTMNNTVINVPAP